MPVPRIEEPRTEMAHILNGGISPGLMHNVEPLGESGVKRKGGRACARRGGTGMEERRNEPV